MKRHWQVIHMAIDTEIFLIVFCCLSCQSKIATHSTRRETYQQNARCVLRIKVLNLIWKNETVYFFIQYKLFILYLYSILSDMIIYIYRWTLKLCKLELSTYLFTYYKCINTLQISHLPSFSIRSFAPLDAKINCCIITEGCLVTTFLIFKSM